MIPPGVQHARCYRPSRPEKACRACHSILSPCRPSTPRCGQKRLWPRCYAGYYLLQLFEGNSSVYPSGTAPPGHQHLTQANLPCLSPALTRFASKITNHRARPWTAKESFSSRSIGFVCSLCQEVRRSMAVTAKQRKRAARLLKTWRDLFANSVRNISAADLIVHHIHTYQHARSKISLMLLFRRSKWSTRKKFCPLWWRLASLCVVNHRGAHVSSRCSERVLGRACIYL